MLAWAAEAGRIVLNHDLSTMVEYAHARMRGGLTMSGVVAIPQSLSIGKILEDFEIMATCSHEDEWAMRVRFIPI